MSGGTAVRAYVGSYTSAGGHGITTASVASGDGALTAPHSTDAVADPSFLALAPRGDVLYAVSETGDGAAAALSLAGDRGRPVLLGAPVPVLGGAPTHLALAGSRLYTANYGSGSVTALPVGADGRLAPPAAVLRHEGSGPDPERQEGPHAHQVLPDPSGRWLLSVDLGTDSVRVCSTDPVSGALGVHGETRLRPGTGPRHLVFHPRGDRAYVVNELAPTVTVCRWDAATGVLTAGEETTLLPAGANADRPGHPSEGVVSPDGRFLWVAIRGRDSIAVLALDAAGDRPALVHSTGCGGHWPRHLTLGPDGSRLYAANERSGDVTWFAVDPATGIPRRTGSLAVPAASCVIFG